MNNQATDSYKAKEEKLLAASQQHCPICGRKVFESKRYPNHVCAECRARATDSQGRKVRLSNQSISGGFAAYYEDDNSPAEEVQTSNTVFIDGAPYYANEAHMGGTVIMPIVK